MNIRLINGSSIEVIESSNQGSKRGNAFPVCFLEDVFNIKILLNYLTTKGDK